MSAGTRGSVSSIPAENLLMFPTSDEGCPSLPMRDNPDSPISQGPTAPDLWLVPPLGNFPCSPGQGHGTVQHHQLLPVLESPAAQSRDPESWCLLYTQDGCWPGCGVWHCAMLGYAHLSDNTMGPSYLYQSPLGPPVPPHPPSSWSMGGCLPPAAQPGCLGDWLMRQSPTAPQGAGGQGHLQGKEGLGALFLIPSGTQARGGPRAV